MRRLWLLILIVSVFALPVNAMEFTAPEVPESAEPFMPEEPQNLQEGIRYILRQSLQRVRPDLSESFCICCSIIVIVMIISLITSFPGVRGKTGILLGAVSISVAMLSSAGTMVTLAANVIGEISQYGKLLLPVLTGALAAQGGVSSSAALYAGTVAFNAVLSGLISGLLIPLVYGYLALSVINSVSGMEAVKEIRDGMKSLVTWLMKTILYIFTGYMGLTGVVSGSTDASVLKAAKLTISGVVPVVGGILSDASEAVLVSAGAAKNAVGIYGMFALLAVWIGPFIKIGTQYLLLRFTGTVSSVFSQKELTQLIQDFASAMGMLLGMTASVCLLFLISVFCFMRGMG